MWTVLSAETSDVGEISQSAGMLNVPLDPIEQLTADAARGLPHVLSSTTRAWRRMIGGEDKTVQCILTTHLCYWGTISGSQFTLM